MTRVVLYEGNLNLYFKNEVKIVYNLPEKAQLPPTKKLKINTDIV